MTLDKEVLQIVHDDMTDSSELSVNADKLEKDKVRLEKSFIKAH